MSQSPIRPAPRANRNFARVNRAAGTIILGLRFEDIHRVGHWLPAQSLAFLLVKDFGDPQGAPFTDVCFEPDAAVNITTASAPYTGSWLPQGGDLDEVDGPLTGCDPNGIWRLVVINTEKDDGLLNDWSLTLNGKDSPTYLWNGISASGNTNEDITSLCSDTYTVTATDDNGCTATESVFVNVNTSILVHNIC